MFGTHGLKNCEEGFLELVSRIKGSDVERIECSKFMVGNSKVHYVTVAMGS